MRTSRLPASRSAPVAARSPDEPPASTARADTVGTLIGDVTKRERRLSEHRDDPRLPPI